mmetsp:Transcript_49355/g.97249  ORF Transcript_49355/g.97249 Transcript_49355/m.97249 type:complete len:277 (-) Transcript_49355:948-1778(-)
MGSVDTLSIKNLKFAFFHINSFLFCDGSCHRSTVKRRHNIRLLVVYPLLLAVQTREVLDSLEIPVLLRLCLELFDQAGVSFRQLVADVETGNGDLRDPLEGLEHRRLERLVFVLLHRLEHSLLDFIEHIREGAVSVLPRPGVSQSREFPLVHTHALHLHPDLGVSVLSHEFICLLSGEALQVDHLHRGGDLDRERPVLSVFNPDECLHEVHRTLQHVQSQRLISQRKVLSNNLLPPTSVSFHDVTIHRLYKQTVSILRRRPLLFALQSRTLLLQNL